MKRFTLSRCAPLCLVNGTIAAAPLVRRFTTAPCLAPYHKRPHSPSTSSPSPRGSSKPSSSHRPRQLVKDRYPPLPVDLADPRRRLAILIDGTNINLLPSPCTSLTHAQQVSALYTTVLPAVMEVGVPVLLRVFGHDLPEAWQPLLAPSPSSTPSGAAQEDEGDGEKRESRFGGLGSGPATSTPATRLPLSGDKTHPSNSSNNNNNVVVPFVQAEYFRVERFIPVPMQIEADARHIFEFRHQNHIEGVCYVCHEVDRSLYTSLMQEQKRTPDSMLELLRGGQELSTKQMNRHNNSKDDLTMNFFNQYVFDELGFAAELCSDGRSKSGA